MVQNKRQEFQTSKNKSLDDRSVLRSATSKNINTVFRQFPCLVHINASWQRNLSGFEPESGLSFCNNDPLTKSVPGICSNTYKKNYHIIFAMYNTEIASSYQGSTSKHTETRNDSSFNGQCKLFEPFDVKLATLPPTLSEASLSIIPLSSFDNIIWENVIIFKIRNKYIMFLTNTNINSTAPKVRELTLIQNDEKSDLQKAPIAWKKDSTDFNIWKAPNWRWRPLSIKKKEKVEGIKR